MVKTVDNGAVRAVIAGVGLTARYERLSMFLGVDGVV